MNIAIVILAAGASRRMGTSKQLLAWGKKSLLGHAISEALQCSPSDVFVVLGANADVIAASIEDYPVKIIRNTAWKKGLSSSIGCAISRIQVQKFDAVLLMLADQPEVDADVLKSLISAYKKSKLSIVATAYENKNGVPAIFNDQYFSKLRALVGDRGAAAVIKNNPNDVLVIRPQKSISDIDTQETYKKLFQLNFRPSIKDK